MCVIFVELMLNMIDILWLHQVDLNILNQWALADDHSTMSSKIAKYLERYREPMGKLISGTLTLPTWKPSQGASEEVTQHLAELNIPCHPANEPSLLLHDLGNPQGELLRRVKRIFDPTTIDRSVRSLKQET